MTSTPRRTRCDLIRRTASSRFDRHRKPFCLSTPPTARLRPRADTSASLGADNLRVPRRTLAIAARRAAGSRSSSPHLAPRTTGLLRDVSRDELEQDNRATFVIVSRFLRKDECLVFSGNRQTSRWTITPCSGAPAAAAICMVFPA